MNSSESSPPFATHSLIVNVSGLFGLAIFMQQMWSGASLDHVLFTAATSGLVAYLALSIGSAVARRIIAQSPDASPPDEPPEPSSDLPEADMETDEAQSASEPQAA